MTKAVRISLVVVAAVVISIVLIWGVFHPHAIRKARQVAGGPPCIPFVNCQP